MADIQIPAGHCVTTTFGLVQGQMAQCLMELRSFSEKQGLTNVVYKFLPGALVEKARNEAVRQLLADPNADWLCQVDGDMVFQPDSLLRLLQTAYAEMPFADAVSAYCPRRGDIALPTIDTGTGTWESWFPNSGTIEVMRTGAAFLLVKRRVFLGLHDPWFRMRVPARPLDFMAEVDNFARIKFDGQNPMRGHPDRYWERLEDCARQDPSTGGNFVPVEVGEDSGFCDRAKNAGFRLFVNTDVVCGHIDAKAITWQDHKRFINDREREHRLISGMLA